MEKFAISPTTPEEASDTIKTVTSSLMHLFFL